MNVFASDPDPYVSARALDDARLNKMTLESGQLLSTAIHTLPALESLRRHVYAPYTPKHPLCLWTAAQPDNFVWLTQHLVGLLDEYTRRRQKRHPVESLLDYFEEARYRLTHNAEPPSVFANHAKSPAAKCDYSHLPIHEAYRTYLAYKWLVLDQRPIKTGHIRPARWTNAAPPAWLAQYTFPHNDDRYVLSPI